MKYIEVEVVDKHVRLMYGQIYMHSEEYSTESNAKRAARNLVKAINTRPMRLVYWHGHHGRRKRIVALVRQVFAIGGDEAVALPTEVAPRLARNATFFDSHLESMGT